MSKFAIIVECQFANQRGKVKAGQERQRTVAEREIIGIVPLEIAQSQEWTVPSEESDDLFYQYREIEACDSDQSVESMIALRKQASKIEALANTALSDDDLKQIVQDQGLLTAVLKRRIEKKAGKNVVVAVPDEEDFLDNEDDQEKYDAEKHEPATDDAFA